MERELPKQFICGGKTYATFERLVPAPYFRKNVLVKERVTRAEIIICGLGFYELFLNGERITKGRLAPYISNPDDLIYYDLYDVTEKLLQGENVLGVLLGNGMQNPFGGEVWDMDKAPFRSAPKFACLLEITYENGQTERIVSDETFKTFPSPIIMNDLRAGEWYDARCEVPGWNLPRFDDGEWSNAVKAELPRGEAVVCRVEPIVTVREIAPVEIRKSHITCFPETREALPVLELPDVEGETEGWLYDFGINTAGVCRLKIKGRAGQKIVLQFGELLAEDGGLDLRAMMFLPHRYNHRDIYICKGGQEEIYIPTFTYHGFRYCLVIGITDEQAERDLLTYEEMHSSLFVRGGFSCSDSVANALWNATLVSDLANFYYFPTDCPHREKNGWTGDAALSAEQMLCLLTSENSFREWMRSIRKAQTEKGSLPGIVPTAGWGFEWGNGPAWDAALFQIPYYVWVYRGDTEIIKENVGAMLRYLYYMDTRRNEKGLLEYGLGDWCHAGRKDADPKAPLAVTDTLTGLDICSKAAEMFEAVGEELPAEYAKGLFKCLREAAREHFLHGNTMTVFGNCQTGQAMALYYGLFEEEEKQKAFAVLRDLIAQSGEHLDVGILGARVLFHVLSQFHQTELAYRMITQKTFPSYGYWLANGATSLWESFQRPEALPESKNHHFFGDIASWFVKNLPGIIVNPNRKDAKEAALKPCFLEALSEADGYYDTVAGRIRSFWKREADRTVTWTVEASEEIYGTMYAPDGYVFDGAERILPLAGGIYHLRPDRNVSV